MKKRYTIFIYEILQVGVKLGKINGGFVGIGGI